MKGILRSIGIVALSIYLTQQLIPSLQLPNISVFFILTGLIFLANFFMDPLTKILFFLPNNFLFLNLVQIFVNFLVLYLVAKSLNEFEINSFEFSGFTGFGVSIQNLHMTALQVTILAAFLISVISQFLKWLTD